MFRRNYPALEELNVAVLPEQVRVLKDQVDLESPPSAQLLFNYAWALLKSPTTADQRKALAIFSALYRDSPDLRREALYYLALGSVKTGDYANARRYAELLQEKEPDNTQFKALKDAIDDRVTQDGLIGLGIAGGVLAVGLGVVGALVRRKR